eukprot:841395-Ditylum_brightwellii.AAC.1
MVPGHKVMSELMAEQVQLVPGTINPFMMEGPALIHFWEGNAKKPFATKEDNFGNRTTAHTGQC